MAETTIEWTAVEHNGVLFPGYTFNPWIGCTKVDALCAHCYAENLMDKRYGRVNWGKGNPRQRTSESNWRKPLAWNREAEASGIRRRVFCASLADVFDAEVPEQWRTDLFELINQTYCLDWLLLTKRPENIAAMSPMPYGEHVWLGSNVWLGTSVGNRKSEERIPLLLSVPAQVHFLSCEPLLGPVDISRYRGIDWVIVGGESGAGCRPMDIAWARSLRYQCRERGIRFFMKQMSGHPKGINPIPDDLMIRELP